MKLGSDAVGITLGVLTIPMALLSVAGMGAGLILAVRQDWHAASLGVALFLLCSILARVLERLVIAIDDAAARSLGRGRRWRAHLAAIVSGALPAAVLLAAEIASLRGVMGATSGGASGGATFLGWLWGYAVATGPWTLFAERVSRFRRTLVGVRAYAGHVAVWLFSLLVWGGGVSPGAAESALLIPAVLPFTVGLLLALSDRDAITNVRV